MASGAAGAAPNPGASIAGASIAGESIADAPTPGAPLPADEESVTPTPSPAAVRSRAPAAAPVAVAVAVARPAARPLEDYTVLDLAAPPGGVALVEAGTVIDGRYRIDRELGRGGMGVVYLARDGWLDRFVALKMIAPSWAKDPEIAQSFQREARALASIRSPYVVQVYAFGLHEGTYFFAMEYVRGRTVKEIIAEHRAHGDTIPPHRTLTILSRIAQGIDAVHAAGILHRDVKPSNIVIEEETGRPVLVDFGLAVPGEDPDAAMALGTAQYMAPEQGGAGVPGARVGRTSDIYALGVTAFEMLTGELPFDTLDRARLMRWHARKTPPALSSKKAELAPFDRTIARALAKDPVDRYPSCTAFAEVLSAAAEVWVSSKLPTLSPPADPEAAPEIKGSLKSPTPMSPLSGGKASSPRTVPEPVFHVLVVDDSPLFRKFTVQATQVAFFRLKSRAVSVRGAASGKEAIALAAAVPPDLVLLDFDMPHLDGLGTLSRLRELPHGHNARVVVLSGRVGAEERWRFAVLGVGEFVKKPIDFRQLVDRIESIARRFQETSRGRADQGDKRKPARKGPAPPG